MENIAYLFFQITKMYNLFLIATEESLQRTILPLPPPEGDKLNARVPYPPLEGAGGGKTMNNCLFGYLVKLWK